MVMAEKVEKSPSRSVLLFNHGFNVCFEDAAECEWLIPIFSNAFE